MLKIINDLELPSIIREEIFKNNSQVVGLLEDSFSEIFCSWFLKIVNEKIVLGSSWVNYTEYKKLLNDFEWHNEKGLGGSGTIMKGDYAGIFWIDGDTNSGGQLLVLDENNVKEIAFKPNCLILFKSDTFHKVEHYYGKKTRISLNFTYDVA